MKRQTKKSLRILAFVMTMLMLVSSVSFATPAAISFSPAALTITTVKKTAASSASIVSPANNSISTSDSLLVSVKLTQPGTIRVTVFEECKAIPQNVSASAVTGSAVTPQALTVPAVTAAAVTDVTLPAVSVAEISGSAVTGPAVSPAAVSPVSVKYESIDTTSFDAIDFTSNSALETYVDRVIEAPVTYVSKENIGFYTKQISVKPGLYKVLVEVLDEEGNVTETVESLVAVKEKPAEVEAPVFEQKQSGAIKLLQNLLKSLFK